MRNEIRLTLLFIALTAFACVGPSEPSAGAQTGPVAEAAPETSADEAPGLIHTVVFWLREDLTDEERMAFVEDNRSLITIPSVKRLYFGPPAPTEPRPIVDSSYDYLLILHFDDLAGQDAYQVDPLHEKMLEEHRDKWTRILVYDSQASDWGSD